MATAQAELVDRVRETLEQELRPVVDRLVDDVVRQLVRARLNGDATAPRAAHSEDAPRAGTKICSGCHEAKRPAEFEKGRARCRDCRRRDERERARQRANGKAQEAAPVPFEQV